MVTWKTSINPIYIRNFDLFKYVCEIDSNNGIIAERERSSLPETIQMWRGFYKNIENGFIGVFASNIGPILFINQDTYPLIKGEFDFKWKKTGFDKKKREFEFYYKGTKVFKIKYPEVKCYYTNPYEEDEIVRDFFLWLYDIRLKDNSYNRFIYSKEN